MKRALLLLAGAAFPAFAQAADLPPPEAAVQAVQAHPTVAAALARVDVARAEGDALRAGTHEVTAQGSLSRREIDADGRHVEYDASISRAFRLPGKASLDRRAGELGVDVFENLMEDARHQAALELGALWYDWLLAAEQYRNAGRLVENQRALVKATESRLKARDAARLELEQAQAASALAEAQLADTAASRDRARSLLGSRFPGLALPADPPAILPPVVPPEGLGQLARLIVERSHEIAAASRQAERQSVLARRAAAERIADPSLGVRLFSERGGEEKGAGILMSMPLGGGHRRALARQAASEARAAESDLLLVQRDIEGNAAADVAEYRAREAAWIASRDAVARAEQSALLAARGQQMGAIDLADRLYAERQAHESRAQELVARATAARLVLKLRIDAHTLWID